MTAKAVINQTTQPTNGPILDEAENDGTEDKYIHLKSASFCFVSIEMGKLITAAISTWMSTKSFKSYAIFTGENL